MCLLCNNNNEDREHLILNCDAHEQIRTKHLNTLRALLNENFTESAVNELMNNPNVLMQCLMDRSNQSVVNILDNHADIRGSIEEISRNLIFDIHNNRAVNILKSN